MIGIGHGIQRGGYPLTCQQIIRSSHAEEIVPGWPLAIESAFPLFRQEAGRLGEEPLARERLKPVACREAAEEMPLKRRCARYLLGEELHCVAVIRHGHQRLNPPHQGGVMAAKSYYDRADDSIERFLKTRHEIRVDLYRPME